MKLKTLITLVKYLLAIWLLWLVFSQLDQEALLSAVKDASPLWLLAAFACFSLGQVASVLRMNAYYKALEKPIPFLWSLRLHYVALFYNIMVPGGVGGDGYRVYILKHAFEYGVKDGVKIQLMTRLNGLLVLLLSVLAACAWLLPRFDWLCLLAAIVGVVIYMAVIPRLFKFSAHMEWRSLPYSFVVQGGNLLAAACLLLALGAVEHFIPYLLLFQVAAIAGMIPITIGGLGLREFTFLYGAELLNGYMATPLHSEMGVMLSLMFFALTLLQSLLGLPFLSQFGKVKV